MDFLDILLRWTLSFFLWTKWLWVTREVDETVTEEAVVKNLRRRLKFENVLLTYSPVNPLWILLSLLLPEDQTSSKLGADSWCPEGAAQGDGISSHLRGSDFSSQNKITR